MLKRFTCSTKKQNRSSQTNYKDNQGGALSGAPLSSYVYKYMWIVRIKKQLSNQKDCTFMSKGVI